MEYSMPTNFNVGFSSQRNDIHVHLSQWQYWWWFWFALLWSLYFLVILRAILFGGENYKPAINTSLRSHGKWGDFLVALIPLTWCGNILINSNFILRMIEWQNEASLFVVRIQGKQWYWSYKYNSDTNYRLQNLFINVGHNNWYRTTTASHRLFSYRNTTLIFIYEYEFKKIHKSILEEKGRDSFKVNKLTNVTHSTEVNTDSQNDTQIALKTIFKYNPSNKLNLNTNSWSFSTTNNLFNLANPAYTPNFVSPLSKKILHQTDLLINNSINLNNNLSRFETDVLDELDESAENLRTKISNFPVKLIKGTLNTHNIDILNNSLTLDKNIFLNYRVNTANITEKISQIEQFWGFRQKKYKKLRAFSFPQHYKFHNRTYTPINNFVHNDTVNKYNLYAGIRTTRNKSEDNPITTSRRLLRTKRTLILPAHINITLITSSYDVVHSWFVPGLGLKIDCVPGRSTHHSLYIDNVGFYYGQCAEICGRYHHHMPIRVCALSYHHFLLWWQTKGLPRLHRSKPLSKKSVLLNKFKFKR